MPQEFYGSFQNNVEITDEKAGQMVNYMHPEYYQTSEAASYGDASPERPAYTDYTHPSHYSVFPRGGSEAQELYTPVDVEWNPGDEERGETRQWQQEKIKSGRVRRLAGLGGLAITIGGWLLKLKGLAFLLKFGTAGVTALISVAFYSLAFGWKFAFGFVGLIFVHEMGHVIAVKAKRLPVTGMIFIPFFGAAVGWSNAKNIKDEAEVAIAGPLAGAIGAAICLGIVVLFHLQNTVWLPLAYIGFFLNLLNLAPVWPLDGGRVFDAINRRVWIVGFVVLLGLQIWFWLQGNLSMWLLFLLILSGSRFLTHKQTPENGAGTSQDGVGAPQDGARIGQDGAGTSHSPYYEISTSSRITLTILYFALVIVLFLGMTMAHSYMGL
jgi:Zn-dependent protease